MEAHDHLRSNNNSIKPNFQGFYFLPLIVMNLFLTVSIHFMSVGSKDFLDFDYLDMEPNSLTLSICCGLLRIAALQDGEIVKERDGLASHENPQRAPTKTTRWLEKWRQR